MAWLGRSIGGILRDEGAGAFVGGKGCWYVSRKIRNLEEVPGIVGRTTALLEHGDQTLTRDRFATIHAFRSNPAPNPTKRSVNRDVLSLAEALQRRVGMGQNTNACARCVIEPLRVGRTPTLNLDDGVSMHGWRNAVR
jgi:hypothetical protein